MAYKPNAEFGVAVKAELAARGMTQGVLGEMCGCNRVTINYIIAGRIWDPETAKKISKVLGIKTPYTPKTALALDEETA